MPATAAILPRETQAYAIKRCEYISAIAAFTPRETQDFASLQGGRLCNFNLKTASKLLYTGHGKQISLTGKNSHTA